MIQVKYLSEPVHMDELRPEEKLTKRCSNVQSEMKKRPNDYSESRCPTYADTG